MKIRWGLLGAVVLGVLGLAFTVNHGASASPASTSIHGTFTFQSDFFGKSTSSTVPEISQLTYKGPLAGIAIDSGSSTSTASGAFSGSGTEYCAACTIGTKTGAFIATYRYAGSGNTYKGSETFVRGFGDLVEIKGGGTFEGTISTNSNTYRLTYTLP
jgi:hypothetical protein